MKGERGFFFLLLAWVIASLRHFPLMLAPCYTRCCRLPVPRVRAHPFPASQQQGSASPGRFGTSTAWTQLKPKLVLISRSVTFAPPHAAPQSSILQDHAILWLFQTKICLPGISPQHWPMGFPAQKAPIPLGQPWVLHPADRDTQHPRGSPARRTLTNKSWHLSP